MKCPRCQHDNREGRRFCSECGASLAVTCPACNFANEPGEKFCGGCGASLAAATGATTGSRFSSPESYTPRHLADKILTSKAALEGERKQVTVLFADLKGSMELLADRDPEEARKLLDPVLEHLMEAVHRYEGTVNQVMGDGIMALFGAPLAHEDHAVRACYASLRMQESVRRYAERIFRSHGVNVRIRVGLNSGEVVVRAIGSDLHMDYTAVGQTTHLAARMEQLADPGSTFLTAATLELVEGYVEVKSRGPVPVKGLTDPVEVYEVTAAGPARTRLQASARRGLTRFVGRDAELQHLWRAQQHASTGHGQVAAIVGEAGVGKSRLVYEFTHSHRMHGWLVLESASVSYGKTTSYLPVIDLLKGYFKIQDQDDFREIREKVTGKLLTLDEALKPTLPALLSLLDVNVDDVAWRALDPVQRRHLTLDGVRRLLLREAREQPLLLIFEDLHWIDGETQALLDGLVESLNSARLVLLVNYRPEYQHSWSNKTAYSQLRLDALPAESATELLDVLLGEDPGLAPLKQLLVKRGNPFFLEETVRTLTETGALAGERGRYRLTQPIAALQVPATVQTILAVRIDRLAPEDKRLLQTASVVGKAVPFTLLRAIAELPDETLRRSLESLQSAEFLYESGLYPDLEYSFKHALTHEVTYGGLLQDRRRTLHAALVGAIEDLGTDRIGENAERLAHHAFRAEMWERAVVYLRRAGAKASARSAYRDAAAYLKQAVTALDHWPDGPEKMAAAIDVRLELRGALTPLAQYDVALATLREADALVEIIDDPVRRARVSVHVSQALRILGNHAEAVREGRRAAALAASSGDIGLQLLTMWRLGQAHLAVGEYAEAIDLLQRAARSSPEIGSGMEDDTWVRSRTWLAMALSSVGRFAEGLVYADEAVRRAEAQDRPLVVIMALGGLGLLSAAMGDLPRGIPVLERAVTISRRWSIVDWFTLLLSRLGYAYTLAGRLEEALSLTEEAVEYGRAYRYMFNHAIHLAMRGQTYLACDRPEDALASAQEALELARRFGERESEVIALTLLGAIFMQHDRLDLGEADRMYSQALHLARQLGARPLVAHCHLGLGKLYGRTGKREQAQEHLTTATTMYREMDMRFWLEQAEQEISRIS